MLAPSNLLWSKLIRRQHLSLGQRSVSIDIHPHEGRLDLLDRPHVALPELGRSRGLDLQREQDNSILWRWIINNILSYVIILNVTYQCTKDKHDTDDDKRFNGCETIGSWNVAGDAIEDVDKDEEDSDEDGHPARNTLRRHEEADPGDNDEHTGGEVVGHNVVGHLPVQRQLEPRHGIISWKYRIVIIIFVTYWQIPPPVRTIETLSDSDNGCMSTQ